MATVDRSAGTQAGTGLRKRIEGYPADDRRLDYLAVLCSAWFLGGLFLDGWAHNHIAELESFFTPWHAVLYSGFFSVAALLVFTQWRNVGRGYAWSRAVPRGYGLSLVGVAIFMVGAAGDMTWHEVFGIEQNLEALFSPTHLVLATGAFLFLGGPLRAAWGRANSQGWRDLFPAVMALLMILSLFTFFMQYADIFSGPGALAVEPRSDMYFGTVTSVVYFLIPAALMTGVLLLGIRRWQLPFGAATLIFTVNALLMLLMRYEFASFYWRTVIASALAGLLTDILILRLRPSVERVVALRLVAFITPFTFSLLVLGAINMSGTRGLWWEIHMWLGVPFVTGAIGVGLSFLLAPPRMPE